MPRIVSGENNIIYWGALYFNNPSRFLKCWKIRLLTQNNFVVQNTNISCISIVYLFLNFPKKYLVDFRFPWYSYPCFIKVSVTLKLCKKSMRIKLHIVGKLHLLQGGKCAKLFSIQYSIWKWRSENYVYNTVLYVEKLLKRKTKNIALVSIFNSSKMKRESILAWIYTGF